MTKTPKTRVEELRRIADDLTNIEAVLDTIQENDLTEMSGLGNGRARSASTCVTPPDPINTG